MKSPIESYDLDFIRKDPPPEFLENEKRIQERMAKMRAEIQESWNDRKEALCAAILTASEHPSDWALCEQYGMGEHTVFFAKKPDDWAPPGMPPRWRFGNPDKFGEYIVTVVDLVAGTDPETIMREWCAPGFWNTVGTVLAYMPKPAPFDENLFVDGGRETET